MEKRDTDSKNKTWSCGSDHELLFAKFKLKKSREDHESSWYDQIKSMIIQWR